MHYLFFCPTRRLLMSNLATFPLLRTNELVPSLVDIGVQITADEIDRPTAAKVVPVYAWFLNQLTQLTLEDVMVAAQLQLDQLEDQVGLNLCS